MTVLSLASALRDGASAAGLAEAKDAALTIARSAECARRSGVFTPPAVLELRALERKALLLALWCGEARARCPEIDRVFDPQAKRPQREASR